MRGTSRPKSWQIVVAPDDRNTIDRFAGTIPLHQTDDLVLVPCSDHIDDDACMTTGADQEQTVHGRRIQRGGLRSGARNRLHSDRGRDLERPDTPTTLGTADRDRARTPEVGGSDVLLPHVQVMTHRGEHIA